MSPAKACPLFYSVFGTLAIGKELPLNTALRLANATEAEKAAMGKIQDCYNEKGLDAKILDLIVMVTYYPSPTPTLRTHMQPVDRWHME